ncbi:hypothetical protein M408DRAFT_82629 [Serendipita vermifera MAFF 305830]|uniref:NADAR domain-containing protein n=1 Tax=Serendipita vermifera MAFF 305830 TaxID=933852 RepID=A0A0C3AL68_SERVB|nr:hypothetical protein M408DRAFT_82753 [Serendipita vermifera MAFF 305830]KIM20041.1 hypothetical protein M408DRAFT_82629 [Serendipita vermifera MAFF 305830]
MAAASAPVSHIPQANVYFSRKNDVYGGFRLDSSHPISWGGVNAPTAEHWFEKSEFIMQLRTSRDIQVASTNAQLEGAERRDWPQVWRKKLEEILYLKFQQHPDLRELLLGTGTSRIIFNHEDSLLGDGGNVNGNSNNGENELGKALMRVRYTLSEQLAREEE